MLTLALIAACLCVLVAYVWIRHTSSDPFNGMPSPKAHPILGHMKGVDGSNIISRIDEWTKQLGPIFRIRIGLENFVVVSDYETIYKVLVTQGKDFGGRLEHSRIHFVFQQTGILFSSKPDKTWLGLRKASHLHLKQFGDGMARLEVIINEVSEDMFKTFENTKGTPFDPYHIIFDTALSTISFLVTGDRLHSNHPIVESMQEIERKGNLYFSSTKMRYVLYDAFPFLRHLRLSGWRDIESIVKRENNMWDDILKHSADNPHLESFVSTMLSHLENDPNCGYSKTDVQKTVTSLLFAGVTTTSATFYAAVNILAHNQDIQEGISKEIEEVAGSARVSLSHRKSMPKTQAFLFEILRYISLVAGGVVHRVVKDVELNGYRIPRDTSVLTNLWFLHHDESFWDEPFTFRLERFLDDDGQLIPADHPNRRHLMPFGAGTRVCLGESLALARLFLWISTLVQTVKVSPAKGNEKSATDPRNYDFEGVLRVTRYNVLFQQR